MPNAHPNRKFCCNKHKDKYHNIHNPRGYYRDSKRYSIEPNDIEDTMHTQDPDALGQD